jgi:rhodanese-related sulfurtransferase
MRRTLVVCILLTCVLTVTSLALAGSVPTPAEPPEGVTIISVADAHQLVAQETIQVFDMRKALNYGKGHIPGAVSLPYKWTKKGHPSQREGKFNMSKLPSDREVKIIFHSDGPNGWKSYYSAKAASEAGYKNVMWLREGFSGWKEKGYSLEN